MAELTNVTAPRQLLCIDVLRGIAACAVMAFHANVFFWRGAGGTSLTRLLFGYGFLGVPLFFIISGFCIHLPYAASDRPLDARAFTIRRLFRIYPPYLVVVVLCTLIGFTHARMFGTATEASWRNFLGHLFFWHYFVPRSAPGTGLSPVFWSISIEVHFYILYVVLLPVIRSVGIGRCTIAALGIGIAYRLLWTTYAGSVSGSMQALLPHRFAGARLGEWLLGAWIAEAYASPHLSLANRRLGGPLTLATGLLSLIGMILLSWSSLCPSSEWLDLTCTFAFAIIVLALVSMEQAQPTIMDFRVLQTIGKWLGDRSYSLYLVHYTVIPLVGTAYALAFHVNDKKTMKGSLAWALVAITGIVASILCAEAMYHLVERPSHRMARVLAAALERRETAP
jgi:peptidoglycan/LPS O-acetylase OafA/YrhL